MKLGTMAKIAAYRDAFGGSYADAYGELIDMGEIRESDALLKRCQRMDEGRGS